MGLTASVVLFQSATTLTYSCLVFQLANKGVKSDWMSSLIRANSRLDCDPEPGTLRCARCPRQVSSRLTRKNPQITSDLHLERLEPYGPERYRR